MIERLANDAWGKRRNIDANRDTKDTLTSANTMRGFTLHEHTDQIGVINMNGRVYDPLIGRFLTADPFIQSPEDLQSFNRYSYVLSNPLAYSDPTGYWSWKKAFKFIAAIVVAVVFPMAMPAIYRATGAAAGFATSMAGSALTEAIAGGLSTAAGGGTANPSPEDSCLGDCSARPAA